MAYDLYPAVDEDYNFPPEVRQAIATAPETRNTVIPMTTTQRNNLTGTDLWDGRLIFNTDTDRINRYDVGTASWGVIADELDAIARYTTAQRDNLSGVAKSDNRVILNTDTDELQRYDAGVNQWVPLGPYNNYVLRLGPGLVNQVERLNLRTDERSQTLGYTGSQLTSVVEKNGTPTVKTTTLGYSGSKLTTVTEVADGKTIVITLNYDGAGNLSSVTRDVT